MSTKVNSIEQKALETLLQFFYDKNILPFSDRLLYEGKFSLQGLSSGNNNSALTPKQALIERYKSLLECIQHYFHLLQDNTLKLLINEALNYRNQQITQTTATPSDQTLLGDWALIIDTMKVALEQRRDLAAQHFQQLIQYGMEGKSSTVDFYLKQLHSSGFIDHLFIGILTETLNALQKQKNEDNYYMLTYFQKVINDLNTEATVKEEVEKQQYTLQQTKITSAKISSSSSSSSSLVTGKTVASSSSSSSSVNDERSKEMVYMEYSQLLNQYIKDSQGNIPILQEKLKQWFQQPPTTSTSSSSKAFSLPDFEFILEENIKACEKANYQNKLKLLQFIKTFTNEYHTTKANESNDIQTILTQNNADITLSKLSTYHAPQFIDRQGQEGGILKNIITYETLFSANTLLFYEGQSNPSSTIIIPTNNKKKKLFRKQMKLKIKSFISLINEFLYKYGWVVIDDLLSLELIKRIRIESNLLRHFYEQSEIWVGKKADIGAHLSVPSIRGDRVLWVCGGHNVLNNEEENDKEDDEEEGDEGDKNNNDFMKKGKKSNHYAPEGVSRVIKTIGEIEPCKLEVKASAPIRKFSALKESITIFDKFIEELKQCQDKDYDNTTIHSIYERSDAMLSIYPGEGARFANHIDNTTQDGRVLTLVNYMNPGWTEEMGGAIRLRPKRHGYQSPASTTSTTDEKEGGRTYPNFSEYDGIDVYPMAGRAVLFFSSQIEHEVMPTYGDRHALTIWYYDKHERKQAIERAKEEGSASKVAAASVETQQAAKEFIAELMGGDEVPEDGGNPTIEELQLLTKKVSSLSDEILEIIASITGAPSVQSFRQGFPMLTVQDLKAMRALFRRMGLQ